MYYTIKQRLVLNLSDIFYKSAMHFNIKRVLSGEFIFYLLTFLKD